MTLRVYACQVCGAQYEWEASAKGGRPRTRCDSCTHHKGERRKQEGERKAVVAGEVHAVASLAAALAVFENDRVAAKVAGINVPDDKLDELVELARGRHPDIVDGDSGALERRLKLVMHLYVTRIMASIDQVSPRDLPHALRAAAQVYDLIGGNANTRFASVQLVVVGADGHPFDPGAPIMIDAECSPA